MERKIMSSLLKWKASPDKKPLLIQGARQVGKTYTALTFGKRHYKNTVYFNMESSSEITAIFERDLNPERIIKELEAQSGQSILTEDTLIIFDEIQACERALTSLKYFEESKTGYHVVAAGSLLGVALKREKSSFPVGKVEMLHMHPMDFEEFLQAIEQEKLCGLIREAYDGFTPLALHGAAMDFYKTYLVVGGMPAAVREYINKRDFDFVNAELKTLNDSYIADMAKYTTPREMTRIMAAWASIPAHLSKENHKFQYKVIKSGARSGDYESAIEWLVSAGIIHKCVHVTQGKMPLSVYAENEAFKVYMVDTGLLCSKFDIAANVVIHTPHSFDGFKGALTENYIHQALAVNGITPYYWSSPGKAEVDFVFQDRQGNILPLEAKSAENVRSKSLRNYADTYKPVFTYRVSGRNFGFENGIKSVPLYAVFCIKP
ncbi:MAG: ATP-binding protein [Gracilibacteraceae bacterium]|jgi:predicted AAA+ superfamily ATPase|nr:ATP-binding protein [Gracilibacteraceae bacterium]